MAAIFPALTQLRSVFGETPKYSAASEIRRKSDSFVTSALPDSCDLGSEREPNLPTLPTFVTIANEPNGEIRVNSNGVETWRKSFSSTVGNRFLAASNRPTSK